jgi:muconolactone delta-isomerase
MDMKLEVVARRPREAATLRAREAARTRELAARGHVLHDRIEADRG